jgi:DNA-binding MarR family transcriptional regulator
MQSSLLAPDDVGPLVALARRRLKQAVAARLAPFSLGTQQFWLLLQLNRHDGISLHELAARSWTDDPTACRMVNRLVKRGVVKSESHPDDRRRFRLSLTAKGKKLCSSLEELAGDVKTDLVRGLSGKDKKQLCDLLKKVIDNTDRIAEAA